MHQETLVSVIVPVYNAEAYVTNCIENIINQTYREIELILVNDGSSDRSGEICEAYAIEDGRIKVIHQKNAGPSAARNAGMEAASGSYFQFVDSDDAIDLGMTERLVQAADDVQLVICGYQKVIISQNRVADSQAFRIQHPGKLSEKAFLERFGELYQDYFLHFTWNKLYDAAVIRSAGLSFDEAVNWGEDLLFNLRYFDHCQQICLLEDIPYHYVYSNADSITSQFRPDLFMNMKRMQGAVRAFLLEHQVYSGENKERFERFYTDRVMTCFWNLFHPDSTFSPEETKAHILEIMEDRQVRESLTAFARGDFEKKLTGALIRRCSADLLYSYFSAKSAVRKRLVPKEKKWV